ncbi:MAG TPA: YbhB/YbcL family Raf kinase inhibitor-like protein [Gemmatimonadaceae bacterium]
MMFVLTSPGFERGAAMPTHFTGEGEDLSPPLEWSGAPREAQSFVLIVDDPDVPDPAAPRRTWVHWVVYDIPATVTQLPEAVSGQTMPEGAREGRNDSGGRGYSGPMPPIGRHRYFFKLYALDRTLGLRDGHTKAELLRAMEGHVLASAELMGTYQCAVGR